MIFFTCSVFILFELSHFLKLPKLNFPLLHLLRRHLNTHHRFALFLLQNHLLDQLFLLQCLLADLGSSFQLVFFFFCSLLSLIFFLLTEQNSLPYHFFFLGLLLFLLVFHPLRFFDCPLDHLLFFHLFHLLSDPKGIFLGVFVRRILSLLLCLFDCLDLIVQF